MGSLKQDRSNEKAKAGMLECGAMPVQGALSWFAECGEPVSTLSV